jgi:hypothetical protein
MSEPRHRADALFVLPRLPTTAALLGELPGWADDLRERRIELVRPGERPDVLVADAARAEEVAGLASGSLVVDGNARLRPRGPDDALVRLLPLPVAGEPALMVDLGRRGAARYGIRHGIVHPERWRTMRNRAASLAARLGLFPAPAGTIVVLSRAGAPQLVAAATEAGAIADPDWLLLVSSGSIVRRDAFLLFPRGGATPEQVVKFSRVPGESAQFERDEHAARLVAETGGAVAARAPSLLARFEAAGRHASLETVASGTKLTNLLREPRSRRVKLAVVEAVAQWLLQVARETAAPPAALEPERSRLERDVLPAWAERGVATGLVAEIPPVPATFQHNDVAEENVVYGDGTFTVLDWEWARPHGLPVGDLVYFAAHVLRIIDGATTEQARDRHFVELFAGRARSSPVLFRWVRELVEALGLPAEAVGPLVTASWLDRGRLSLTERRRAEDLGRTTLDPAFAERAARTWIDEPALGPAWSRWR